MSSEILFLEYPKCSTCKKAKKWLGEHGVSYTARHIVEDNPSADELRAWHERSGLSLKRFFNTSGMLYREMELSKKLPDMDEAEQYALLASNGMLVKRPLLVTDATVIPGFKEDAWMRALGLEPQPYVVRSTYALPSPLSRHQRMSVVFSSRRSSWLTSTSAPG